MPPRPDHCIGAYSTSLKDIWQKTHYVHNMDRVLKCSIPSLLGGRAEQQLELGIQSYLCRLVSTYKVAHFSLAARIQIGEDIRTSSMMLLC